jgi:tryptophanyl-tRNA synthetase
MSKSENENATIYLADDDDKIRKKIMKAKTDGGPTEPNSEMPDYIENIFMLMKLVSTEEHYNKFLADFNQCEIRYGDMKKQLAEDMIAFVSPIREKAADLQNDIPRLQKIMQEGKEKARASASETLTAARKLIGINY